MSAVADNQREGSLSPAANKQSPQEYLELLYNISRELAAALDLRKVLQRVLLLSMQNVGAISGSIIVLDESGRPIESAIVIGDRVHEHTTQQLGIIFEQGLAGWVARHRQPTLVPDTSVDQRWLRRPDDADDQTGPKSAVSAPILAREKLVGVLTLVHPRPGTFARDQLDLAQAIADQAGIAILNARLYDESQQRASIMTALANSSMAITGSLEQEEVLQRILDQTSQALRVEVVSLALIEPQTDELVFCASTGKHSRNVVGIRLKLGQGVAGWVAKEGQGAVVPDTSQDPRFYPSVDNFTGFSTKAIACAPIRWHGQVIGVLEALNPLDGVFEKDALLVLSGIGGLAGTAIRHAQLFEKLQAAHQRYRDLFDSNVDAILITDLQGHIVEANRQAEILTGLEKLDLQTRGIESFGAVDPQAVGADFAILSSGETISYETNLNAGQEQAIPVHVYTRKVEIESVPHFQWILQDITERKNLEALRNDLISMIYHDLRSPLGNVVSSLDVIETMLPLEDDQALKSLLSIAIRSTERIQRLTNSLLDMRRIEVGQAVTNLQSYSPYSLAKEALEAVQTTADTKNQRLILTMKPDLPQILADGDMIKRVLINLLENAIKYTPQDSQVTVGGFSRKDEVEMWVRDNGPGIPPSERERIFDKFTGVSLLPVGCRGAWWTYLG
jgi:NtrC-family two-component system sensor histidine kinase KinB